MKRFIALSVAGVIALPALATEFNSVIPTSSAITFVSTQMGVSVEGKFERFKAQVSLDPAKVETGKAQIEVDLVSVSTGSSEADDEVRGKSWFDVQDFPSAKFVASAVKSLGGGRYEASGKLTIKGKTLDVTAPFTTKIGPAGMVLEGSLPILRSQYSIGEGAWSDASTVADEVQVRFRLLLGAAKK